MVHGPKASTPQQLRQFIRIVVVPLIAAPPFAAPIADHDTMHHRRQEIVDPVRLRPLLERHVHRAPHATRELHQRLLLRRQHAPQEHAPLLRPHRTHRCCLVHIETDILVRLGHEGRSWL